MSAAAGRNAALSPSSAGGWSWEGGSHGVLRLRVGPKGVATDGREAVGDGGKDRAPLRAGGAEPMDGRGCRKVATLGSLGGGLAMRRCSTSLSTADCNSCCRRWSSNGRCPRALSARSSSWRPKGGALAPPRSPRPSSSSRSSRRLLFSAIIATVTHGTDTRPLRVPYPPCRYPPRSSLPDRVTSAQTGAKLREGDGVEGIFTRDTRAWHGVGRVHARGKVERRSQAVGLRRPQTGRSAALAGPRKPCAVLGVFCSRLYLLQFIF